MVVWVGKRGRVDESSEGVKLEPVAVLLCDGDGDRGASYGMASSGTEAAGCASLRSHISVAPWGVLDELSPGVVLDGLCTGDGGRGASSGMASSGIEAAGCTALGSNVSIVSRLVLDAA